MDTLHTKQTYPERVELRGVIGDWGIGELATILNDWIIILESQKRLLAPIIERLREKTWSHSTVSEVQSLVLLFLLIIVMIILYCSEMDRFE